MRGVPPTRSACDNCHSLKTRCSRETYSIECRRCIRLKLRCSYSAPLPMGRPRRRPKKSLDMGHHISENALGVLTPEYDRTEYDGMEYDGFDPTQAFLHEWTSGDVVADPHDAAFNLRDGTLSTDCFSLSGRIETATDTGHLPFAEDNDISNLIVDHPPTLPSFEPGVCTNIDTQAREHGSGRKSDHIVGPVPHALFAEDGQGVLGSSPLSKLSALQIELHRLTSKAAPKSASAQFLGPRLDEIFAAAKALLDVLVELSAAAERALCATSTIPDMSPASALFDSGANDFYDTATALVVLACYVRLLGLYKSLAIRCRYPAEAAGNTIPEATSANVGTTDHGSTMPTVRLGSFNLLDLPELNASMNLHLADGMYRRLHSTTSSYFRKVSLWNDVGCVSPNGSSQSGSPMVEFVRTAVSEIEEKEIEIANMFRQSSEA